MWAPGELDTAVPCGVDADEHLPMFARLLPIPHHGFGPHVRARQRLVVPMQLLFKGRTGISFCNFNRVRSSESLIRILLYTWQSIFLSLFLFFPLCWTHWQVTFASHGAIRTVKMVGHSTDGLGCHPFIICACGCRLRMYMGWLLITITPRHSQNDFSYGA